MKWYAMSVFGLGLVGARLVRTELHAQRGLQSSLDYDITQSLVEVTTDEVPSIVTESISTVVYREPMDEPVASNVPKYLLPSGDSIPQMSVIKA